MTQPQSPRLTPDVASVPEPGGVNEPLREADPLPGVAAAEVLQGPGAVPGVGLAPGHEDVSSRHRAAVNIAPD